MKALLVAILTLPFVAFGQGVNPIPSQATTVVEPYTFLLNTTFLGNIAVTGTVTGSNLSGTNTGDQAAGTGLTGTSTLNVIANADGSIVSNANDIQVGVLASDAQHGNRGGGGLHANAIAAGAAGFLTGADKTKLDNTSGTNTGDAPLTSKNEGSTLSSATTSIDCVGSSVNCTNVGGAVTLTVTTTGVDTLAAVGASPNANGASISGTTLTLQPANGSNPGTMSAADYTKLSGVATGATAGVTTMAAAGGTANANGATISGTTLTLNPASASFAGIVTTGTQTFAGTKTFSGVNFNGNIQAPAYLQSQTNTSGDIRGNLTNTSTTYPAVLIYNSVVQTGATSSIVGFFNEGAGSITTPVLKIRKEGTLDFDSTNDVANPGNRTINKPAGRSSFAATASTAVITNSLVAATSTVIAILQTVDATCTSILTVVPAAGSFTVTSNAICTGTTNFGWFIADL